MIEKIYIRDEGEILLIDTRSKEGIESSLAKYLDVTIDELYKYVNHAAMEAQDGSGLDLNIFESEVLGIVSDLCPMKAIDEIYVYHLSRRLNCDIQCNSSDNLKLLLLNASPLSEFLKVHGVIFIETDGHPAIVYKEKLVDLSNTDKTDVCYLRSRLGYNKGREDYCINGFALREQLMKNTYTRSLYRCPEFMEKLSHFLKKPEIVSDYFHNSTYYCYTYKLNISEIIFDDNDLLDENEKIDYFIVQLFNILLTYTGIARSDYYHNNPIIRTKDDFCISATAFVDKEEITLDMMKWK